MLTASDTERLIEWHSTLSRDPEGRVSGTFSSGADVTEKHRAIQSWREAEERMRSALSYAEVGI